MTPISHALLPLVFGRRWLPVRADGAPGWRASLVVAGFGVLPDALNPHLGLDARWSSWSHTLAAWLAVSAGLAIVTCVWIRAAEGRRTAALCSAAYLAHLLCDAVSGGAPLLSPWAPGVVGGSWLPLVWWPVADGLLLGWAYCAYRWRPLRNRLRRARAPGEIG